MKDNKTKNVNWEKDAPPDAKPLLPDVFRSIDWKWIGITYIVTTIFFGVVAIIEKNWLALIGGFFTITFIVLCACISIAWSVYKNGR
jgi:hypothetical protein